MTDRTKRIVINSITQTIPMNPLGRESCSAEASTIPGFHLHCLEGNRSIYIWKSACSTVSNDFLDVLESAGRELMETQIILTCAVPLILYASVNLLTFFLGRWCHNLIYPLTQKYRRIRSHFQCGGFFSYSTAFTAADIFSSFCFEKYSFVSPMITFLSAMIAIRFGIIINAFVISARSQIGSSDKNGASAIAAM